MIEKRLECGAGNRFPAFTEPHDSNVANRYEADATTRKGAVLGRRSPLCRSLTYSGDVLRCKRWPDLESERQRETPLSPPPRRADGSIACVEGPGRSLRSRPHVVPSRGATSNCTLFHLTSTTQFTFQVPQLVPRAHLHRPWHPTARPV
jgi:hypothetical protein